MKPYYQDLHTTLYNQDFRTNDLPGESVQCVVTSPPYWGLRKYSGEQDLIWGKQDCEHRWGDTILREAQRGGPATTASTKQLSNIGTRDQMQEKRQCGNICALCGAWKGAYGLEPTPEMYVQHTIEILREIRRVLRKDGVVFWNIGDSYSGGNRKSDKPQSFAKGDNRDLPIDERPSRMMGNHSIIKPKDLCLIPFRVAIAAQEDGWWVRSIIIWSKPNPMPESVTDRPTGSHEYILLLTKSARYYWDMEAVREVDNVATNVLEYSYGKENLFPLQKSLTDNGVLPTQEQEKPQFMVQSMHQEESEIMEADSKWGGISNQRQPEIQADRARQKATEETRTIPTAGKIQEKLSANAKRQGSQPSSMCEEKSQDSYSGDTNGGGMAEYPREIPEQMRLLREQKRGSDARPCNPSQQGRSPHEREYSASLPTLQLQQSGQTTGRNLRSVWSFPTQPFPAAHFAVFPEKLPEICIKAATPEVGCCAKCGGPWTQITKQEKATPRSVVSPHAAPPGQRAHSSYTHERYDELSRIDTIDWVPTCKCWRYAPDLPIIDGMGFKEPYPKVPSVVLDPFSGAGTTLWVAKKLNRKAIGFDISEEYCKLTVERLRQQVLL